MNAVEIEEAVERLAAEPFDAAAFPFRFLEAFGNKDATIRKLRSGASNLSDVEGSVLQRNNIHIGIAKPGEVSAKLAALKASPKTASAKAKLVLATDGEMLELEDLATGETRACPYAEMAAKAFGLLLPLAGITTVREIQNNPIDIRATGRLNKLYIELLKENPEWEKAERRPDLNHFMARLIFCFFAEDTDIFRSSSLFTKTVEQFSDSQSKNTHEVIGEIFRAMDVKPADRATEKVRPFADVFPYVNGGLFSGSKDVPRFTKMARAYLLQAGSLDWKQINPDIFGSMIQAIAEDEERGELGMHYTSVPNILKVLNPLFLDDLNEQLEKAGDNARMLLNLRKRMAHIRVFDPACGSGNFLVIAYKHMRAIEAEVNRRRGEPDRRSDIPLTNFRGIEIRDFAAEIARLALIIAEFQCDVLYRGQKDALAEFLPLNAENWITCGNALRLDWISLMDETGTGVRFHADDLFHTPLDQAQIDFENEPSETHICGNPPYKGSQDQTDSQKEDLRHCFSGRIGSTNALDYVSGWFLKATEYVAINNCQVSFVTTNSINQGRQVSLLWPTLLGEEQEIFFAVPSFLWQNLASKKAAVTVSIIGLRKRKSSKKRIFSESAVQEVDFIGAYLVPRHKTIVSQARTPLALERAMLTGSMPNDNGGLILSADEARELVQRFPESRRFLRKFIGSDDGINGEFRYCLWIRDTEEGLARTVAPIARRLEIVEAHRKGSSRETTNALASAAHAFGERRHQETQALIVPRHSSEDRQYLPSIPVGSDVVVADSAIFLPDFELTDISIYSSRLHWIWIATVCGKIKEDFRYSNTLGWNTWTPLKTLAKSVSI
ncbi:MAG: class I SAM-dependent DNA methyltransferase [Aestuariivirga sp.]